MKSWDTRWTIGRIGVVAPDHNDRYSVAPCVVHGHGRMLQTHRTVTQRHQGLTGSLEVAVRHCDTRLLMHTVDVLWHDILTIVDQRLMNGSEARCAIGRDVFDAQGLDDVDHEVRACFTVHAPAQIMGHAAFVLNAMT